MTHRKNSRAMKDAIGRLFLARREQYALDSLSTALLLHRCLELEQKSLYQHVMRRCKQGMLSINPVPIENIDLQVFGSKEIFPLHKTRECKIC